MQAPYQTLPGQNGGLQAVPKAKSNLLHICGEPLVGLKGGQNMSVFRPQAWQSV